MKRIALSLVVFVAAGFLWAQEAQSPAEKIGLHLGLHSYTTRQMPLMEGIDLNISLGFKWMSISGSAKMKPGDKATLVTFSDEQLATIKKKLDENGIKVANIGVMKFTGKEADDRKVFELAKKLGTDVIVAEPKQDIMDAVEKLAKEYNIKVALHNHPGAANDPKSSTYWNPDIALAALKGRSPLMGVCADTGHWVRSGLNPVECLKKLEGRIICLHFKDIKSRNRNGEDVIYGTGLGNPKAQLEELKRQNFKGFLGIEIDHLPKDLPADLKADAKWFNETMAELAK